MTSQPFCTIIFFIVLSLVGISLVPRLSVNLNPSYELPSLRVQFRLPSSSPQVVEQRATAPLENAFSQLGELQEITSVSHYHRGQITLTFEKTADLDFKRFEVATLIRQVYPSLPPTLSYPTLTPASGSNDDQAPFLVYTVQAPLSAYRIKQATEERLTPYLASLDGIEAVDIYGAEALQITVETDYERLSRLGLSLTDIQQTLRTVAQSSDLGVHTTATGQVVTVTTTDQLPSLRHLEQLSLRTPSGTTIRLNDVAHVYQEEQSAQRLFRIDGQNFVRVSL